MGVFLCIFAWKFPNFFNIVSIETFFQNCISVQKMAEIYSLGGAIVLFAAYSVYACIFQDFFHRFLLPFQSSSPSIFRPINTSLTSSTNIPEIYGFMCSYSPHIHLKFGEIRFINQWFITESLHVGHFSPKFRGPLARKLELRYQNISLWRKWYGHPLSTCQVWWRLVYAQWHENENENVFVFFYFVCLFVLSRWVFWSRRPAAMFSSLTYRLIFMEFVHFLDFRGRNVLSNWLHHFQLNC